MRSGPRADRSQARRAPRMRPGPGLAAGLLALACAGAGAQQVRVLVQSSPLAGFSHYHAGENWQALRVGERLTLVREADNRHDANAVRIDWRGLPLGYLPRAENRGVAAELDAGTRLEGRIAALVAHPDPRRRVRVEVYVLP